MRPFAQCDEAAKRGRIYGERKRSANSARAARERLRSTDFRHSQTRSRDARMAVA